MHVRGFTRSPSSGVSPSARGTYAGAAERVTYLKSLGVTSVELLPVQQYDPQEGNYWGYMPLNFFAPHRSYAADQSDPRREFKAMVKALHEAGIAVILDVVYNHAAEGITPGRPTASGESTTRPITSPRTTPAARTGTSPAAGTRSPATTSPYAS
jgi:glycogen operon protein